MQPGTKPFNSDRNGEPETDLHVHHHKKFRVHQHKNYYIQAILQLISNLLWFFIEVYYRFRLSRGKVVIGYSGSKFLL